MRNLSGAFSAAKSAASARPVPILKLEFGGEVGTRYYSEEALTEPVAAEGRVTDWGVLRSAVAMKPSSVVGDARLRLADPDGALAAMRAQVDLQGARATLYQFFKGLEGSDMVPLARGRIASPVEWDESTRELTVEVTDISTWFDRTVGNLADRESFPEVAAEDEGRMLPVVYGKVARARAVHVAAGGRARLAAAIEDETATGFVVDDASGFPQGTEITVRIGCEDIRGSFSGNAFTVAERGCAIASGSTSAYTDNACVIVDTDLGCADGQYVGCFVRMWVPYAGELRSQTGRYGGGSWQYRRIIRCESPGVLEFYPPFSPAADAKPYATDIFLQSGAVWKPPRGTPFGIVTFPSSHEAGAEVRRVLDKYVYIANDVPSVAVRRVECWGVRRNRLARFRTRRGVFAGFSGGLFVDDPQVLEGLFGPAEEASDVEETRFGWITLDGCLYEVNTNDTTSFPSLGRAVTTVTLWRNPTELAGYEFTRDEIRVDIEGAETAGDGAGSLIENPAEVVRDVLTRFGGLAEGDFDGDSFDDGASRMVGLRFAFALERPRRLMELAQDLAFQCRCSLLWEAGLARLRWLVCGAGEPVAAIGDSGRELDSLRIAKSELDDVVTEIKARWIESGEARSLVVSDASAEERFGRRSAELDLWAHPAREGARSVAEFWLRRLRDVWEIVRLTTYLNTVELERLDAVTLALPDWYPSGQLAVVEGVSHRSGSGARGEIDRIEYRLRVPYFPGCAGSCEAHCETAGCESSTELAGCESACEAACQGPCELGCQNAFQAGCAQNCQVACMAGCQVACTGMNMVGCFGVETGTPPEGACAQACQTLCQYRSTAGCELDTCMVTCVVGCEAGACEMACTSACEAAGCESAACTSSCTVTGCETVCQTAAQHCFEDSCRAGSCQLACTVALTAPCSGDCQAGCVMSCTLLCQTACTSACEEAGCTVCCEQSCTSGCEDGCQSSCEVGCESLGCQTVNCETACEAGCETGCEISCETQCETLCQTACQQGCETGCEISCEYGCTQYCEFGCQGQEEPCHGNCQASGCVTICETEVTG